MLVILALLGLLFFPTLIGMYPILGDCIFWTVMIIASISLIVLIYQEILYRLKSVRKKKNLKNFNSIFIAINWKNQRLKG
ncbi:hypothetical protein ZYGNAAKF_CDS0161 [Enterococcus phage VRE9_2]